MLWLILGVILLAIAIAGGALARFAMTEHYSYSRERRHAWECQAGEESLRSRSGP